MLLYVNCFRDGGALLEAHPQGDAHTAVNLPDADAELLARLIDTPELSAALAKLFLAGVTAGERAVRGGVGNGRAGS
jgi:hypothetical protein